MTTRDTIEGYFEALRRRSGWDAFLADTMTFTSFTAPVKEVRGKAQYLAATRRFYSTIRSLDVKDLLIDGDRACARTRYELEPPAGSPFTSEVAEIFAVRGGKIESFAIYFDSAPFPK